MRFFGKTQKQFQFKPNLMYLRNPKQQNHDISSKF